MCAWTETNLGIWQGSDELNMNGHSLKATKSGPYKELSTPRKETPPDAMEYRRKEEELMFPKDGTSP